MKSNHLVQEAKSQIQVTRNQDASFSQFLPKSNRPTVNEQPNNDRIMLKNDKSSVEANCESSMDHEYFILEPNAESQNCQMLDKEKENIEKYDHQYFVLEPQGTE